MKFSRGVIFVALSVALACDEPPREAEASVDAIAEEWEEALADLREDARRSMERLDEEMEGLADQYDDVGDEVAAEWEQAQAEFRQFRTEVQRDLERADNVAQDEARELRAEISEDLEEMTVRVERARLGALRERDEFLQASRTMLDDAQSSFESLSAELESLSADTRTELSQDLEELRSEAQDLRDRIDAMGDRAAEEFADERDDLADALASFTARAQRHLFEIEREL